jgi:hypothetical protein
LQRFRASAPGVTAAAAGLTAVAVLSMLFVAISHYPYYMPYVNSLSFGRPSYTLMSDANLDWNQALPDVARFAQERGIQKLKIDEYGWTETSAFVPGSELWDCQHPSSDDAGQWVVVSADMIVDSHNCIWLMQYPNQPLGGGAMYAVHLPAQIPAAGTAGGPPAGDFRQLFKMFNREPRVWFQEMVRDPNKLSDMIREMQAQYQAETEKRKKKK